MTFFKKALLATATAGLMINTALAAPDLLWFQSQSDDSTEAGTYTKEGPWTVALVFPDLSNSWRVQAVEEARVTAEADTRIAELIVTNYQEDVSVMISDM